MISNQILQSTLDGLKAIARVELCVIDVDGKTAATTADGLEEYLPQARAFVDSPADSQEVQGNQFFKIYDEQQLEYILIVGGAGENIYMIGKMAAFQIQNLLVAYKERFDKDNFIKNLLLDNLLLVDIYSRAKKLYIPVDAQRVVLIIECSAGREDNVLEQMRPVFGNNNRDFITAVDENNVIIVKALTENDEMKFCTRCGSPMNPMSEVPEKISLSDNSNAKGIVSKPIHLYLSRKLDNFSLVS